MEPSQTQSERSRRKRPERLENGEEEFVFERTGRDERAANGSALDERTGSRRRRAAPPASPPAPPEAAPGPAPASRGVSLGTALRRYPILALLPVVVLAAAGITLGLRRPPTYTASTTINVGAPDINSQATPGYVLAEQTLASAYSREVTSQFVVNPVARQMHVSPCRGRLASELVGGAEQPDVHDQRHRAQPAERDRAGGRCHVGAAALHQRARPGRDLVEPAADPVPERPADR